MIGSDEVMIVDVVSGALLSIDGRDATVVVNGDKVGASTVFKLGDLVGTGSRYRADDFLNSITLTDHTQGERWELV